ncbi:Macrolide export ATP-binding/permease protein macB [Fibrella aestuarina BUZ 2]|uniref:Macrolide export ATP-binding/permease protein macB n=1 Tax=Fibrella aestuarina BUZ 2 TaxID=1166018 RepID=I0K1V6_9BACT|nr:ABC transporter permease [Fibrella aestuarina]CCG98109.1 Macrolide export ATP-binding/permease protein macB [Fibrella aestuarina BUZ 2]
MFTNYLKIALRTIWKQKAHSSINVIGLSVAFASAILLFLAAQFELSYDQFHQNRERIHRLSLKEVHTDRVEYGTNMPIPMMPMLRANYPGQIQYATRFEESDGQIVRNGRIWNGDVDYVDADFLRMFSFPMAKGDARTALNNLNDLVLNEQVAQAVFGENEPVGQLLSLNLNGVKKAFVVRGVMRNAPASSTLENEVLIRFENFPEYQSSRDQWNWRTHDVYVQLANGVRAETFEKQMVPFVKKQYAEDIAQARRQGAQPDERGEFVSLRLTNLSDVHFDRVNDHRAVDRTYPRVLLGVSLLIMLIAGINFVNLSIARSLNRAKEVGMRKALGALRQQIIGQFSGEALLICSIALITGLLLVVVLLPRYNAIFNGHLSFAQLQQPGIWLGLLVSFTLISLLTGVYPAWLASRFNAVEVLKGKVGRGGRVGGVRNTLIVLQFAVSVLLIGCTLVVWRQMNYLRDKPLGYDQTQVISIPVGYETNGYRLLTYLRNQLADQPQILDITGSDINLGRGKDGASSKSKYSFTLDEKKYQTNALNIDYDYVETLGLKLVAGRTLSRQFPSDSAKSCLINESMVRHMGVKDPIGMIIPIEGGKTVVGVVNDYHFASLHDQIEPITLFFNKPFGLSYIFVRVAATNPASTMALLERTYRTMAPNSQFQGSFLNENVNNQYKREQRLATVFVTAAWLAILLSCVGLFAIALISIQARTKEIGVRKVLGASVPNIVALLSKDFLKLVVIGIVIATPLAWWAMNQWLADFAYRIDVSWWVFALAGLLAIGIALLTVSFQSIKAALMNPVKSLRSE